MTNYTNDWRLNIPIGSKIVITCNNHNEEHLFYGYNHNKTLGSCFPEHTSSIAEKMVYFPINAVQAVYYNTPIENIMNNTIEKQMEKININ